MTMNPALRNLLFGLPTNPWQQNNNTWSGDAATGLVNTPTLGADIVANGSMEAGSPPTSWTATGTSTLTSVSDEHTGGVGTKSLNAARGTTDNSAFQNLTVVVGTWYVFDAWLRNVDATSAQFQHNMTEVPSLGSVALPAVTGTSWVNQIGTLKITATGGNIRCLVVGIATNNGRFDLITMKPLTLSDLFIVRKGSATPAIVQCAVTFANPCVAGVVTNLDSLSSPANFVLGVADGTNKAYLFKYVAGTWTTLVNASVTIVAGGIIDVRRVDNTTFQLFYNGTQVGTNQTISDAGIISNTLHGGFATHANVPIVGLTVS